MKSFAHIFLSLIFFATLAACGGGGGGSTPTSNSSGSSDPVPVNSAEGSWLSFSPASIDVVQYQGDTRPEIKITATSSKVIDGVFNVAIIDSKGVLQPGFWLGRPTPMQYTVGVYTAENLAVGTYATYLEVRMCRDDAKVCNTPVPGSPWYVPFKVTVKAGFNLTPLRVLPQLSSWNETIGRATNTSYVPASFDVAAFSRRWSLAASIYGWTDLYDAVPALTHDNGLVFVTLNTSGLSELAAINEDTGSYAWRSKVEGGGFTQPAASNGRVYVTSVVGTPLWTLDQKTGGLVSKVNVSSPTGGILGFQAPIVVGQDLFATNAPSSGGIALGKIAGASNSLAWNVNVPLSTNVRPAVDANYAYIFTQGLLTAINAKDGTTAYKIPSAKAVSVNTGTSPVVLSPSQVAYVATGVSLDAFNVTARTAAWSQNASTVGLPTVAGNVVYILTTANGKTTLQAHAADSGNLLWSSNPLDGSFSRLVVTDNLAFVSSKNNTLAIDLQTHSTVWQYGLGGNISISNRGVLYISSGRTIVAINLQ